MKGCQFASMWDQLAKANAVASPMKMSTTETLIITAALFKLADSLTPMTRMAVTTTIAAKAKMSTFAEIACPNSEKESEGVGLNGTFAPKKLTRLLTYPLHPTATVAAPKAYSRTRAQPIIQATSSPSVA